jgi:SAM-dependent methyltransferase
VLSKQRGLDAVFLAADFYTADLPEQGFDVVICVETLFYVPDQARFVAKLASLLKPGGYLIITVLNKFVYLRRSDIGPPEPGQIRQWLDRSEVHRLLHRHFQILKSSTFAPKGDRGILRIVESHKVNRLAGWFLSPTTIKRLKERLGLGHCRLIVARRTVSP